MSRSSSTLANVVTVYPVVGVLPQFVQDPNGLLSKLMGVSDGPVAMPLGPATLYLIHHPDHLRHVLLDNHHNYRKGPMFQRAELLLGNGLVLSEGDAWKRQRKLMTPPFRPRNLEAFLPVLAEVIKQRLDVWRMATEPLNMLPEMSHITMRALLKWLFSYDLTEEMIARFDRAFTVVAKHVALRMPTWFLPEWVPLPGRAEALAASAEIRSLIGEFVAERRTGGKQRDDLLGTMLDARGDDGKGMSLEQICDEIQVVIFGGYDSTSVALTWTWQLLATHPEAASRVQQEVRSVVPEGPPTLRQLGKLEYLERVFKEALRLRPPFTTSPRMAQEPDVIGGQQIDAGAALLLSTAVHRNPDFWEHPDAFHPDHFLPERVAARHRFAFIPFGGGPRVCIGANVALLEAKMVLALALQQFDIKRAIGDPPMMSRLGTSRPAGHVLIEFDRRSRRASGFRRRAFRHSEAPTPPISRRSRAVAAGCPAHSRHSTLPPPA